MKAINIFTKLKEIGFNNLEMIESKIKVNIGFMAKDFEEEYCSEYSKFQDLKFKLMNWCSIRGISCKRDGGAMIIFGE